MTNTIITFVLFYESNILMTVFDFFIKIMIFVISTLWQSRAKGKAIGMKLNNNVTTSKIIR